MFKFIFLLFLSLPAFADPWSDADTKREAVFFGLRTFTYLKTYEAARNDWQGLTEQNKILGKKPHSDKVTAYYAVHSLVHLGISHVLPADWRHGFQYITIGEVGVAATSWYRISGVRINFPLN